MKRSELIHAIATKNPDLNQKDITDCIETILDAAKSALCIGNRVEVRGFGSFNINIAPERIGRNPATGESVRVPAKPKIHFKAGKELKEGINPHQV